MADLNELQSAGTTKVIGSDASGLETTAVNATGNGDLNTADILRSGGTQGTITVGTSAVEVKVGGSALSDRKLVNIDNTSSTVLYWGYTSGVTTSSYAGRIFKDQQIFLPAGPSCTIYLIAGTAGNSVRIGEGA